MSIIYTGEGFVQRRMMRLIAAMTSGGIRMPKNYNDRVCKNGWKNHSFPKGFGV
jgi:hypothetical protein